MTAYGYVRVSRMDEDSPKQSPMVQRERIEALASAKGDTDLVFARFDLDVSGGKTMTDRPGFAEIVAAIEDGTCTAVYAYDLSRLFRNVPEQITFFEMTTRRGIPVRFVEGDLGEVAGATGELMLTVLGAMNQWQRKVTSEKIRASLERRHVEHHGGDRDAATRCRERGCAGRNGGRLYADAEVVIDAFRSTGSLTRAARKLNEDGVPTRNARSRGWSASAVSSVVGREAPDLIVPGERRGRPTSRPFRFAKLLRCGHCDGLLSPSYDAKRNHTSYYCHAADTTPHGRKRVSEAGLVAAIQLEADRWMIHAKRVPVDGDPREATKIDALERQVDELAASGLDVTSLRADLEARRAALAPGRWVRRVAVGELGMVGDIGAADPARVNDFLRRMFDRVVIDMGADGKRGEARVIEAAWRDPSLRAVDQDDAA